jgi:hypothetical protein
MFFYLCNKKGIPVVVVQKMLLDKYGFDMHHATILQSIRKIAEMIEGDGDYTNLIDKLMNVSVNV